TRFEVCSRLDLLALPPASATASTLTCPPPLTLRVLSTVTATSSLTLVRPVSGGGTTKTLAKLSRWTSDRPRRIESSASLMNSSNSFGLPSKSPSRASSVRPAPDSGWSAGAAWRNQCRSGGRAEKTPGHLEKFFSPSRYESDSLTAIGHGRMERASHGAD